MTRYVLGFLFMDGKVLLIRKERPKWQRGSWNGVGGHIEDGEEPRAAMERECFEETDIVVPAERWNKFCTMERPGDFVCYCYRALIPLGGEESGDWHKKTDEIPGWFHVKDVTGGMPCLPNVPWLIGLALDLDEKEPVGVRYKERKT